MPWEHFSHDADIGIRGIGKTIQEAFEMTAMALTGIIINPEKIPANITIQVYCQAPNIELLLVDWINQIIYEMDTKKILFSHFSVSIDDHHLTGELQGEYIDKLIKDFGVDVKGATYTALKVVKENDQWLAQCVVDV